MRIDVHQHLWPEGLIAALARRGRPPLVRRRDGHWVLRLEGEPDWPFDLAAHDPVARAATVAEDGMDMALVALSSPLGIETLPPDEAEELLAAYHEGVADLPAAFAPWAAAGLLEADPELLAGRLGQGCVGLCLPAGAISSPRAVERSGPLLTVLERRRAPLFVHPGPAPADPDAPGAPPWWPALTSYVAQMHAAWHGFHAFVRPAHLRLRVCFAMLAGLAPLQAERLAARGGGGPVDPDVYLDTASYGPRAVDAVIRAVGIRPLVHGSDRPVVAPRDPSLGPAVADALRVDNPARLFDLQEVLV